jgi:hypothetical protein
MVAAARFHVADSAATMPSLPAQEFAAAGCEAMSIPHCSVRKNCSEANGWKEFFSHLIFLPSQGRAARFSPSADVITFFGLIHLKQAKVRLSQRSK